MILIRTSLVDLSPDPQSCFCGNCQEDMLFRASYMRAWALLLVLSQSASAFQGPAPHSRSNKGLFTRFQSRDPYYQGGPPPGAIVPGVSQMHVLVSQQRPASKQFRLSDLQRAGGASCGRVLEDSQDRWPWSEYRSARPDGGCAPQ